MSNYTAQRLSTYWDVKTKIRNGQRQCWIWISALRIGPAESREGRAGARIGARLHCTAAMFKSYKTGMCSALSDIRVVFIEIFQHFALNLDIGALKHNGVFVELDNRSDLTQPWSQSPSEILLKSKKIGKKNPEFFPPGPTPPVQDGAG